jgi:hypothetical protein
MEIRNDNPINPASGTINVLISAHESNQILFVLSFLSSPLVHFWSCYEKEVASLFLAKPLFENLQVMPVRRTEAEKLSMLDQRIICPLLLSLLTHFFLFCI